MLIAKFRDTNFVLQKEQTHKKAFWSTRNLHAIMWNSGRLDSNILPRAVKGGYFPKATEKGKILGNLLDKGAENLENCPKVQDLFDERTWILLELPV